MYISGAAIAFGLPKSPIGVTVFIAVVLGLSYAAISKLIRIPGPLTVAEPEEELDGDEVAEEQPDVPLPGAAAAADVVTEDEVAVDDVPVIPPLASAAPEPPAVLRAVIEAVRIGERRVSIGDPASLVMTALPRNQAGMLPLIDRDEAGRAGQVARQYIIDNRLLTFVFSREAGEGPLSLAEIKIDRP